MDRICIQCNKIKNSSEYQASSRSTSDSYVVAIEKYDLVDDDGFPLIGDWIKIENNRAILQCGLRPYIYDLNAKDGWYCNDCFDKLEKEEDKPIKCNICDTRYPSIFPKEGIKQGFGCAAFVHKNLICCQWGSEYDRYYYECLTEFKDNDNICDNCIDKFLIDGSIILKERR